MVNTALTDTYQVVTTTKALKNGVSTCRRMYYNKETWVMANQPVNEFTPDFYSNLFTTIRFSVPNRHHLNLFPGYKI